MRSGGSRDEGDAMPYDKQWLIQTLRHLGYTEAADEAARELPDPLSSEELEKFGDRHGINRGEIMSRLGGSP
jgi:hypothetical protein